MAGPNDKKGIGGGEIDDWASAIDEWDANLNFGEEPAKPEPAPAAVATAPTPAAPDVAAAPVEELEVAEAPPLAPPPGTETVDGEEPLPLEAAPAPGGALAAPGDDPLMQLFDGDMDLPEDAGQALGDLIGSDAVELPPAGAIAPPDEVGEDVEIGIDEDVAPVPEAAAEPAVDAVEAVEEVPLFADEPSAGGATRVASVDEFSSLLSSSQHSDESRPGGAPSTPAPATASSAPSPFDDDDDMPEIEATYGTPEPEVRPHEAREPEEPAPAADDFASTFGGESTRVASRDEFQALLDLPMGELDDDPFAPAPARPQALAQGGVATRESPRGTIGIGAPSAAGSAPSSTAASPATAPAAAAAGAAVFDALDDDFYDDISIEAGRESSAPKPAEPAAPALDEERDRELSEPILVDPPLNASRDRASDPDRTPLPVADGEEDSLFSTPVPSPAAASAGAAGTKPVEATRTTLSDEEAAPLLNVPERVEPASPAEATLRDRLTLYDTERLLQQDGPRAVALAIAAARLCEQLGDLPGASERYEAALENDSTSIAALRGLRRVRLAEGQPDRVLALLDRELERAADAERRALEALGAELHAVRGDRDLARAAHERALTARATDLGARLALVDLSAADANAAPAGSGLDELAAPLGALTDALAQSTDPRLRAALLIERARLDEAAGRLREAVTRYREALSLDPQAPAAAWGLFRIAVRTPSEADDLEPHARLVDAAPRSPGRAALERRLALLRQRTPEGGGAAAARPLLVAASPDNLVAESSLCALERADGRLDEAAASLARLVELESDPGRAADLFVTLGQLQEERGNVALAVAAYQRAAQLAVEDPRAARALERARAAGGDKASELDRHLAAATERPEQAPLAWTRAARLLDELGRRDEALGRLDEALAAQPGYPPAVALAVELRLADGRPAEAATVLLGAAEAAGDDAALQAALRERAARLYARANHIDDALAALAPLLDGVTAGATDPAPIRWLEQRILEGAGDAARLARSLTAEAELAESTDRARALQLWHAAGLLFALSATEDDLTAGIEAQRRVLALDPQVAPAALELVTLLVRRGAVDEVPAVLDLRRAAAEGRAEATLADARLALSIAEDAADPARARTLLDEAARAAAAANRATAAYTELADRLARRFGDDAARAEALDREAALLAEEGSVEQRFALRVAAAERLVAAGQLEAAADRWHKALALRPGNPIARAGLERALLAARNHAALADLALADLKESTDASKKALAYERLSYVDGELRGERESALLGYESILETDHAHHRAMRVLERAYLEGGRLADLVALYERMGLVVGDPQLASALHLDRARLRRRIAAMTATDAAPETAAAELEASIDNDVRLALFKHERYRPALRHALGRARMSGDHVKEAELSSRLADTVFADGDGRSAAVLDTRAAEALQLLERAGDARALFRRANERSGGGHLPALLGLLDSALVGSDWDTAESAAAQAGSAFVQPAARARTLLLAGALSVEKLNDPRRALPTLGQALEVEPRSLEAFRRLRQVRTELGEHAALAELYRKRLEVETDGRRLIALHLELAKLARDQLADPTLARKELQAVLAEDANHLEALKMLGDLAWAAAAWAEAADALIKRARVEKSRTEMREIFVRLGTIYGDQDKLPDAKRAIACWSRVSKAAPNDLVALEYLSNLSMKEWDYQGALDATRRLAELDPDKLRKIGHLHRVAKIYEEGFKDARHALEAYRAALELDPMHLPSIGELARFFDRQTDVQSMRVHLDRTIVRVRQLLDRDTFDPTALHALFKIFNWRRAPDRAFMAAGILDHIGQADADEKALLGKAHGRDLQPGSAFADAALDDTLFDARIPAGFRHLFRLLDEALSRPFRTDLKKLGVGKHERLPPRGHAIRDLMNRMAADLGLRELDLYVTAAHPTALIVEITEPLSVVLGAKLVEGAHEAEVRFYLGRLLKMVQCHMALPLRLASEDLAVVVGAIVRQFIPDFVPAGFEEKQIATEAARLAKVIPKKMHQELFPFAMECASPTLDLRQLGPALVDTANRAGLLAAGAMPPALTALRRLGDEAQVRALVRFAMSDELAELRRQLGTVIA